MQRDLFISFSETKIEVLSRWIDLCNHQSRLKISDEPQTTRKQVTSLVARRLFVQADITFEQDWKKINEWMIELCCTKR